MQGDYWEPNVGYIQDSETGESIKVDFNTGEGLDAYRRIRIGDARKLVEELGGDDDGTVDSESATIWQKVEDVFDRIGNFLSRD